MIKTKTRNDIVTNPNSTTLPNFFKPVADKQEAKQLLAYVLQSNVAKAKKMYSVNPRLLFIEASAEEAAAGIDENGKAVHRIIEKTPYGAMLSTGDIKMLEDIPVDYFDLVIDKEKGMTFRQLAEEQFIQQFPNGFDYPLSTYDFSPLVYAITNDRELIHTGIASKATEELLAKFRKDFMPGIVRVGHHFNLQDLIKAHVVFERNWPLWTRHQSFLFECKVIGYLEKLVTAVDAKVLYRAGASSGRSVCTLTRETLSRKCDRLGALYAELQQQPLKLSSDRKHRCLIP